jgi:hypothetical protein
VDTRSLDNTSLLYSIRINERALNAQLSVVRKDYIGPMLRSVFCFMACGVSRDKLIRVG